MYYIETQKKETVHCTPIATGLTAVESICVISLQGS